MQRSLTTSARIVLFLGMGFACSGCIGATGSPLDARDAAVRQRVARCREIVPLERLPKASDIVAVVPNTHNIRSGKERYGTIIAGAQIQLGLAVTPATMVNDLACHQVDVALGRVPLGDDDPFALPAAWVTTDVVVDGDATTVKLEGPTWDDGKEILARAHRFWGR